MKFLRKWISKRRPWIFEKSRIPIWLSYLAPIEIFAFSFGPFVFCRDEMPTRTRTHETIHYHQQIELLFVFQWILYGAFFLKGLICEKSGTAAYRHNPFELEAYDNDDDESYLEKRRLFSWMKYT